MLHQKSSQYFSAKRPHRAFAFVHVDALETAERDILCLYVPFLDLEYRNRSLWHILQTTYFQNSGLLIHNLARYSEEGKLSAVSRDTLQK